MVKGAGAKARPVAAFGALLQELRRNRSVEGVLHQLRLRPTYVDTNQGTVSGYEQGYHLKPDPVVLWGLAVTYGVSVEGLIAVLRANRGNPHLTLDAARHVLLEHANGPRPEMAASALEAAEKRLFEAVADLQSLRETIEPDTNKRSRG